MRAQAAAAQAAAEAALAAALQEAADAEVEEGLRPADLPDGWVAHYCPTSGREYYYHKETRVTQWHAPVNAEEKAVSAKLPWAVVRKAIDEAAEG